MQRQTNAVQTRAELPFEEHLPRKEAIRISSNAPAMKIFTFSFGQNHQKREKGKKFLKESTESSGASSPALSCCSLASSWSISKQQSFLIDFLITPKHKVQQRNLIKPFMRTATERELQKARWHFRRGKQLAESVCAHTRLIAHWVKKKEKTGPEMSD